MTDVELTDEKLDAMRAIGDPVLDQAIAEHAARRGPGETHRLLGTLFRTKTMPDDQPLVAAIPDVREDELGDRAQILRGQALFGLFGPEMLLTLGSYSLPLAFAAGHGVQVVFRARRLKDDPIRRLCDTAQMVINVMRPGALDRGQVGWNSARKVRLIHALIRHAVGADPERPWPREWGVPINQEDQLGTLLSFSVAVLQGLRRMGAVISTSEADAYVATWGAVGRLLGIDPSLLPRTEATAQAWAKRIGERQFRATPEGEELNAELLKAVGSLFPIPGYATSLTHFFLEDSVFGRDVANILKLPQPNWTRWLVASRAAQKRVLLPWIERVPGARRRRSFIARHLAREMILLKRPDNVTAFEVPEALKHDWGI